MASTNHQLPETYRDDVFAPSPIASDPEAQSSPLSTDTSFRYPSRRRRLYICLLLEVMVLAIVGTVVGIRLSSSSLHQGNSDTGAAATAPTEDLASPSSSSSLDRANVGIYETVVQVAGTDALNNVTHPYRKAMDWIQNVDTMMVLPNQTHFMQRYILAYLYYSTSIRHPWDSDCVAIAPPPAAVDTTATTSTTTTACMHRQPRAFGCSEPYVYDEIPAQKWLSSASECDWAGIACDEYNQVNTISIAGVNMTGTFPEGIAALPFLQEIRLADGELTGTLPAILGDMKHLIGVRLSKHQFTGTIPDSWYNSRSFQFLQVGCNELTGSINPNIQQLKNVRGLDLQTNDMTGTLPKELFDLSSMKGLILSQNLFSGTIPTMISSFHTILELYLSRNQLSGSIPTELGLLTKLERLGFGNNQLNGTIPNELYNVTTLYHMEINDNDINGVLLPQVGKLAGINYFHIENNNLSGTLPTELGQMKEISLFTASGNNFSGSVPSELCSRRTTVNGDAGLQRDLEELQVDCAVQSNGVAEIACEKNCCTLCCDPDGANCAPM